MARATEERGPVTTPMKKIHEGFNMCQEVLDTAIDHWESFYYDGKKKRGREARKAVLALKKAAAEVRMMFKEIDL